MNVAGVSAASRATRDAAGCVRSSSAAKSKPPSRITTSSPSSTQVHRERTQRVDDLGEVPREWLVVAAAQLDVFTVDECEAAQFRPLRFVRVRADRQLALERCEHRLDHQRHHAIPAPSAPSRSCARELVKAVGELPKNIATAGQRLEPGSCTTQPNRSRNDQCNSRSFHCCSSRRPAASLIPIRSSPTIPCEDEASESYESSELAASGDGRWAGTSGCMNLWDDNGFSTPPGAQGIRLVVKNDGFNDKASSLVNKTGSYWRIYEARLRGYSVCIKPHSHITNLKTHQALIGSWGDRISSMQRIGSNQVKYCLQIIGDSN